MIISAGELVGTTGPDLPPEALSEITPTLSVGYFPATDRLDLSKRSASYAQLYSGQLWVYVVCRKIAMATARLTLNTWTATPDGKVPADDSPYGRLLNRPNPKMSPFDLWLWTAATFEVYGEAFWVKLRDPKTGLPHGLWPMHPTRCVVRRNPDGDAEYLFTLGSINGQLAAFAEEDVVAFLAFNPVDRMRGMSQLEPLRQTLLTEDASRRATASWWERGARPSVALTHPGSLSPKAADRLKASWDSRHGGADLMGGTAVLEEGMTPQIIQLSAEEMQYIQSRKLNREEVCAAADIPPPVVHILDHATFCLPADAQVSTTTGPKRIVDVQPGDKVWAFNGDDLAESEVSWSGQTGEEPLYTVRTANRTLRATGNHPVLVARRPYIDGSGNRTRYGDPEFVYVRVDELSKGDLLVAAHGQADTFKRTHAPNGREVSEFLMEFAGIMMGDGSVSTTNGVVSIAHADDARYIDHYRHIASELFTQRDGAITWGHSGRSSRFVSISAARELTELGFSGNARTKSIPGWVFECSQHARFAFLRGIIEADGSVDKNGRISFSLCNEQMVVQVRDMMIGLGLPVTNIRESRQKVTLPNGKPFDAHMWVFTATDPGQNQFIGSWDAQDFARLSDGKPFSPNYYRYADRAGRSIEPPRGAQLSKVCRITKSDEVVPVYDLTVPDAHNFVADGLVVHNSNISEQMRSMYRDTMAPRLEQFEACIDRSLRTDFDPDGTLGLSARFALDDVLRGDFEVRATAVSQLIINGVMKPSEARPLFDLPDAGEPEADRLYGNAALVPLGSNAMTVQPVGTDGELLPQPVKAVAAEIRQLRIAENTPEPVGLDLEDIQ